MKVVLIGKLYMCLQKEKRKKQKNERSHASIITALLEAEKAL